MATVPYYTLKVPSVSCCSVLPTGEQNLSTGSKKYVEVHAFVQKWPLVRSCGEKTRPCDFGYKYTAKNFFLTQICHMYVSNMITYMTHICVIIGGT